MTDERALDSSFDRNGRVVQLQEKILNKNASNTQVYIDDRQHGRFDVAKLSAAGDQAKVETVVDAGLDKFYENDAKFNEISGYEDMRELLSSEDALSGGYSGGEEIFLEDHSPMDESESTEDEVDDDVGIDVTYKNRRQCNDPSSLVVIGRGICLHTPPRDGPIEKEKGSQRPQPEGEAESDASSPTTDDIQIDPEIFLPTPSTPPESKRAGSSRRPTLSPVIEEDVREYMQTWRYEDEDDEREGDVDSGAGDSTSNVVESVINLGSDEDYANEISRVLSSAAVDAALAEIDNEEEKIRPPKNPPTGCNDDLDDSCDDIVIILPEAQELNYYNVPVGCSLDDSLQDAANARAQLDAQADFLENSLNCLEVTLDRMSLNEAVMPDGSVVFLRDQLRKAKTGHLLRAWERTKDQPADEYLSCAELETPLAQIQRELYQEQIKSYNTANEEMRTAVTQATLQEQALRGQARQVQQTYNGLEQNIANLSNELVGLQDRQHHLQNAMMEERVAKEAAQREHERIYRRSSSDVIDANNDILRESHIRRPRQPEWTSDQSASTSSSEDIPTSSLYQHEGGQRWWSQRGSRQQECDYIQPPPWRRGYRPSGGRRFGFGQRPNWRSNHGNWRWSETRDGTRPWERRRPPPPPHVHRPFVDRPRPPPPAPFTPPFKRETEVMLTQYFHEMGRVENLLRERGFAKGPAATAPVTPYRPHPTRYQRYSGYHRGGWDQRMGSRSLPSMRGYGFPYRERSQRSADWFDTSRSQTNNQMSQRHSEEEMPATTVVHAAASA
ncbi:uncharacterized protein LOC129282948 [Lytechinus pictus]|uniref:uncharacterized protein LOC129282948 n=1 Tax=Lytechinus pictus TaxID=7653 RepID=UPI0030BA1776